MCLPSVLTDRYLHVLRDHLGLDAEAPDGLNGGVVFQHAGLNHLLVNHAPYDPEYLELAVMGSLAGRYDLPTREAVACSLSRRHKTLTAMATSGGLLVSVDSVVAPAKVLPSTLILISVLPRFLDQIATVCARLHAELEFQVLTSGLDRPEPTGPADEDR